MASTLPFKLGEPLKFYGVDNNRFKLGPDVFEAQEDPSDGYRSYLGTVAKVAEPGDVFFRKPLDTVTAREVDHVKRGNYYFDGYELLGKDGHVWLRFGTDNVDDYYPFFVFEYTPKSKAGAR